MIPKDIKLAHTIGQISFTSFTPFIPTNATFLDFFECDSDAIFQQVQYRKLNVPKKVSCNGVLALTFDDSYFVKYYHPEQFGIAPGNITEILLTNYTQIITNVNGKTLF